MTALSFRTHVDKESGITWVSSQTSYIFDTEKRSEPQFLIEGYSSDQGLPDWRILNVTLLTLPLLTQPWYLSDQGFKDRNDLSRISDPWPSSTMLGGWRHPLVILHIVFRSFCIPENCLRSKMFSGRYPLVIQHSYGKSPFLKGRLTISMAIFNSYVTNYQRVHKQTTIWSWVILRFVALW